MEKEIFGWGGTSITFLYKFPQIYKFYKSKTSKGISIISYLIQTFGYILYAIHGIIINDPPCFTMGAISFFFNTVLCCQYFYYNHYFDRIEVEVEVEVDSI